MPILLRLRNSAFKNLVKILMGLERFNVFYLCNVLVPWASCRQATLEIFTP